MAVIDPAEVHYYQPLWTLVGGGRAPLARSVRTEGSVMPSAVTWIAEPAAEIDPETRSVGLGDGSTVGYDALVVCPAIQLDWGRLPGAAETLGRDECRRTTRPAWPPRPGR